MWCRKASTLCKLKHKIKPAVRLTYAPYLSICSSVLAKFCLQSRNQSKTHKCIFVGILPQKDNFTHDVVLKTEKNCCQFYLHSASYLLFWINDESALQMVEFTAAFICFKPVRFVQLDLGLTTSCTNVFFYHQLVALCPSADDGQAVCCWVFGHFYAFWSRNWWEWWERTKKI